MVSRLIDIPPIMGRDDLPSGGPGQSDTSPLCRSGLALGVSRLPSAWSSHLPSSGVSVLEMDISGLSRGTDLWDALAMSMIGSLLRVPEPSASPAARFSRAGRIGAAAALVLGAGLQLAAFSIERANEATIDRLRWIAEHPGQANLAKLCDLLAMPFLLGSALVYVLLSRQRSRRLAYAAGILLGTGLAGLTAVQGSETTQSTSRRTAASTW